MACHAVARLAKEDAHCRDAGEGWSARDDLHVQGCLILGQVGLLFPVNHAPMKLLDPSVLHALLDSGVTKEEGQKSLPLNSFTNT